MKKQRLLLIFLFSVGVLSAGWLIREISLSDKETVSPAVFGQAQQSHFDLAQPEQWTLLVTGDVIPARSVNFQAIKRNDFMWPFRGVSTVLRSGDLTLINLETPLIESCTPTNEGMKFCGDRRFIQSLAESGVDVANLANNHSLNYGWQSLAETEKALLKAGIQTTGFSAAGVDCRENIYCSKLLIKTIKNIKVGFLGYNAVGQKLDREAVESEITKADRQVDVLVVSVHWGKEYEPLPKADAGLAPDDPVIFGKLFIDWGADVVVGNHPHVVQPVQWYGDKPVFYALGNTVFDQEWSEETKKGILAKIYFSDKAIVRDKLEIINIGIKNYGEAFMH